MSARKALFSLHLVVALLLPIVLLLPASAHAATTTFICLNGDWNTPSCWSGGVVPGPDDTAVVRGVTVSVNATPPTNPGRVEIGGQTRFDIAAGQALTVEESMVIAHNDPNTSVVQFIGPVSGQGSVGFAPGATLSIALASQLQLIRNLTFTLPGPGAATTWTSGTIVFEGAAGRTTLVVPPGAIFPLLDGLTLYASTVSDRVLNQGTIVKDGPGRANISPLLVNSGLVDHRQGTLGAASGFTRLTQDAGETAVASGASFEVDMTLNGGTLSGRGRVTRVTNNGGTVAPGAPGEHGELTVTDVYTQEAGGVLEIDIEGSSLGSGGSSGYDRLAVGGARGIADLAGTLAIVNGPSFVPQASDVFTILTRTSGGGSFATLTGADTPAGDYQASYAATEVNLGFVPDASASADLSIVKTDSQDPVTVGGALTYTLEVSNAGPDAAAGVHVTDTLPAGVTFVSASTSQGTCSHASGTVSCDVGSIASGGGTTVTIEVTPAFAGSISNSASVSSATADPNSGNNPDSEETLVQATQTGTVVVRAVGDAAAQVGFIGPVTGNTIHFLDGGDSLTFPGLPTGPYTLERSSGGSANYDAALSCTDPDGGTSVTADRADIDLDSSETVECTFTLTPRVGTIAVRAVGDAEGIGIITDPRTDGTYTIRTGETAIFADLPSGAYTLHSTTHSYLEMAFECVDPDGGTSVAGDRADIDLDTGETVKCVVTFTRRVGTIVVRAVGDAGGIGIITDPRTDGTYTIRTGETAIFADLPSGAYTLHSTTHSYLEMAFECIDPDGGTSVAGDRADVDLDTGETVECVVTFTRESGPPTLNVPGGMTVDATRPAGAVVSFTATASDDVDPSPAVTCAPASGSVFRVGTTTVTCTATDDAGNSASGRFTITVRGAPAQITELIDKTLRFLDLPALAPMLRARLTAAADFLLASNRPAACAALNLYRAAARVAPPSALSAAEKAELRADANRIRAVIGCG